MSVWTERALENIRLATSQALLSTGYIRASWELPFPRLPIYRDASAVVNLSTGGDALRGYSSVIFVWDRIYTQHTRLIIKLVEDSLADSGVMYATIDRSWAARGFYGDWIDVSGYPKQPQVSPAEGTDGLIFNSVQLMINNLTIVSDPASF